MAGIVEDCEVKTLAKNYAEDFISCKVLQDIEKIVSNFSGNEYRVSKRGKEVFRDVAGPVFLSSLCSLFIDSGRQGEGMKTDENQTI